MCANRRGPALSQRRAVEHRRVRQPVQGFHYLADTGQQEEGLSVRQWSQHDARFHGFEREVKFWI
jgi:hypothetical protein